MIFEYLKVEQDQGYILFSIYCQIYLCLHNYRLSDFAEKNPIIFYDQQNIEYVPADQTKPKGRIYLNIKSNICRRHNEQFVCIDVHCTQIIKYVINSK